MTFMWRRYIPMTNRFRLARIFISHGPPDGNRMGVDGVKRGCWDASHRLSLKGIVRNKTRNVAALANNYLGDKRKVACHFGAYLGLGHSPPNDQRARRANIDGPQVLQCFGQLGRPEGPVAPDVNPPQKNNECHSISSTSPRALTVYPRGGTRGSGQSL
jgi:hypothetical protein